MLAERPVRSIITAIAGAAQRWCDPDFPPRRAALAAACERTGYSPPVVTFAFDHLFGSLEPTGIEATIARELGSLDVLDRFVDVERRSKRRALPVGDVCIISSRTTIGVAILPAVFALCAKCNVEVKDREDHLVAAFFSTLAQELGEFAQAARAEVWDSRHEARGLNAYDAVVAFGNDETLARIHAAASPHARFIPYASRASAGYVAREALSDERAADALARAAARDVVLYESEGCLSLHALFAERGGRVSAERFAELVAAAIREAAVEFPPAARSAQTMARAAAARDLAAFRAAGGRGRVFSDAAASYVLTFDPPQDEPPAFLPRVLGLSSVAGPAELGTYVRRHALPLEAVAVAGLRADIADMLIRMGVVRIAPLGTLQTPPIGACHGGRPRIAEFVRWIADET
jgi:hypothetical protein